MATEQPLSSKRRMQGLRRHTFTLFLATTATLAVIGGIMSRHPVFTVSSAVIGLVGTLAWIVAGARKDLTNDEMVEIQNHLLIQAGVGNPYYERAIREIRKTGHAGHARRDLVDAVRKDPTNWNAMKYLVGADVLALGVLTFLELGDSEQFRSLLAEAEVFATRAVQLNSNDAYVRQLLGILLDIKGNHKAAQREFLNSAELAPNAFWKLLIATSCGLENEHETELQYIIEAREQGVGGWLVDFYQARALNSCGQFKEAEGFARAALKQRPSNPAILMELKNSLYFQAKMVRASLIEIQMGIRVVFLARKRATTFVKHGILHFLVGITAILSKRLWPLTKQKAFLFTFQFNTIPPDQPERQLCRILLDEGHHHTALELATNAIVLVPESPYLRMLTSESLFLTGEPSAAEATLKELLDSQPHNETLVTEIGKLLHRFRPEKISSVSHS